MEQIRRLEKQFVGRGEVKGFKFLRLRSNKYGFCTKWIQMTERYIMRYLKEKSTNSMPVRVIPVQSRLANGHGHTGIEKRLWLNLKHWKLDRLRQSFRQGNDINSLDTMLYIN